MVNTPDLKGREAILKVHARNKPFEDDVDLSVIAKTTPGFTGADLSNLLNEAALLAARRGAKRISMHDVEDATIKVIAGPEKKSRAISEKERRLTAYHEAGHAIVTRFCPTQSPVHQISIIPRGRAGGYTLSLPLEDKYYSSRQEMREEIVVLLGGRAAEALCLDDISTGASNDIERATDIARKMVTKYGMSEVLGPVVYGGGEHEVFLGRDFSQGRGYSEDVSSQIDCEIRRLIDEGYARAMELLKEHEDKLHETAALLLKQEKIDGKQFEALFEAPASAPQAGPGNGEASAAGQPSEAAQDEQISPKPEGQDSSDSSNLKNRPRRQTGADAGGGPGKDSRPSRALPLCPRTRPFPKTLQQKRPPICGGLFCWRAFLFFSGNLVFAPRANLLALVFMQPLRAVAKRTVIFKFFQDNGVPLTVNLHSIPGRNSKRVPQLNRQNNAAELIHFSHNPC